MCGGDLEVNEGVTIAECEYCGTKQTVPKAMDENLQNLFNRANILRIKSEFDKAEKLYEKIIQVDSTQPEAYWGIILCKYGIEYVDDPTTFKKVPTCHRASFDSIIADDDYKSALENADMSQRAIYEEQAKEIDRIQKEILALAQKEENYDVFICYKETDADGKRTHDSVIANDIYYQLTQEGFKVFYAAITLEGKLGTSYEPIIFAALNSAKVMLSIGTRPEYFNAVWVKNEWSRFLKIIKKDRSKLLIPCYRDMDAYELPEEFTHLQAQDMSKIGFINDLVRGIKKVIRKNEPKQTTVVTESVVTTANVNVAPLLRRAFLFLEDGYWERADNFCEQVLNQDPENAQAYLAKLMIELRVRKQDELKDCPEPFNSSNSYRKAFRFADDNLKATLIGYIEYINNRNENERLDSIYNKAKMLMSAGISESNYKEAAQLFESISEYLDSEYLVHTCYEKAEEARKDFVLAEGKAKMTGEDVLNYVSAIKLFESIPGWKDADEQVDICKQRIKELEIEQEEKERQDKRDKKFAIIVISIVVAILFALVAFFIVMSYVIIPNNKYNKMLSLKASNQLAEAYSICKELENYKDCDDIAEELEDIFYKEAADLYLAGDADSAANLLSDNGIEDLGLYYVSKGRYKDAVNIGLTYIVIPNGVTSIDDYAFKDCSKLTSVTIPDSVTSIGAYAFEDCSGLTSVTIGNGVTSIGFDAFNGCSGLTSVTIGNGVTSIGYDAFNGCSGLTSIEIPDSVTSIGNYAFNGCSGLTSVTIPDSVTSIGYSAFHDCTALTSIEIPDSVTSIGNYAFYGCSGLTSIKYRGTEEQWADISKGSNWDSNTGSYTITYNYTGE